MHLQTEAQNLRYNLYVKRDGVTYIYFFCLTNKLTIMCGLLLFLAFILLAAGWDSVLRAFVIYPLIYLFGRALYEYLRDKYQNRK